MKRRRAAGHIVLPAFYDVDPDHVAQQTGSYATAFDDHGINFKDDMDKVQKWRVALAEVAGQRGGTVLRDR